MSKAARKQCPTVPSGKVRGRQLWGDTDRKGGTEKRGTHKPIILAIQETGRRMESFRLATLSQDRKGLGSSARVSANLAGRRGVQS